MVSAFRKKLILVYKKEIQVSENSFVRISTGLDFWNEKNNSVLFF